MDELKIDLHGVRLPSNDWVDIPYTSLQVRTQATDPFGTIYVRWNPDAARPAAADKFWLEFEN